VVEENSYFPKGIPDFLFEKNSILIDIGANIGVFSVFASINTNSKIIAIEPHPDNYTLLLRNLELNHIDNIITINSAVGERNESRFLAIGKVLSGCQLIPSGYSLPAMKKSIEIDCRTLIDIMQKGNINLEREPCFIKLDCEGSEYEIMKSIDDEILSRIKVISMEYHLKNGKDSMKRLIKRLKRLAFNVEIRPDKVHPTLGSIYAFQG
jgi:FkbM family methyltransferase